MKGLSKIISRLVFFAVLFLGFVACNQDLHQHEFATEWTTDADSHWHAAICEHTDQVSDKSDHIWDDGEVTTEATCVAEGVKTYKCTVCTFSKTEVVPKSKNHEWDDGTVTKDATCTEDGSKTVTCTVCKKTETQVITKSHKWNEKSVIREATCSEEGLYGVVCTVCKAADVQPIAKKSHSYETPVTVPATCAVEGSITLNCSVCKYQDVESIEKLTTHTWNEGVVTTAPTITEDGARTYTCSVCHITRSEPIEKIGTKKTIILDSKTKDKAIVIPFRELCPELTSIVEGDSLTINYEITSDEDIENFQLEITYITKWYNTDDLYIQELDFYADSEISEGTTLSDSQNFTINVTCCKKDLSNVYLKVYGRPKNGDSANVVIDMESILDTTDRISPITITYDANGGQCPIASEVIYPRQEITVEAIKEKSFFYSWVDTKIDCDNSYPDYDYETFTIAPNKDCTLYAWWDKDYRTYFFDPYEPINLSILELYPDAVVEMYFFNSDKNQKVGLGTTDVDFLDLSNSDKANSNQYIFVKDLLDYYKANPNGKKCFYSTTDCRFTFFYLENFFYGTWTRGSGNYMYRVIFNEDNTFFMFYNENEMSYDPHYYKGTYKIDLEKIVFNIGKEFLGSYGYKNDSDEIEWSDCEKTKTFYYEKEGFGVNRFRLYTSSNKTNDNFVVYLCRPESDDE